MAFDPDLLKQLPPEQALDYLKANYRLTDIPAAWSGGIPGTETEMNGLTYPSNWQGGTYMGGSLATEDEIAEARSPRGDAFGNTVMPPFMDESGAFSGPQVMMDSYDPDRSYIVSFDRSGVPIHVGQQLGSSWYDKEVLGLPVGLLLPLMGAAAGAYFPGAVAAEGAAPIIQASGTEALIGGTAADTLGAGGASAFDLAAAYDAGLTGVGSNVGLAEAAGGLSLADAAAYDAALEGVGSNVGNFSLADAAAYDAALEGVGSNVGSQAGSLVDGAKSIWNTGKAAYTAASPVLSAGKKLYNALTGSGSGSGSGSSGGALGGLGGIGGILGLALLMAQLKKDRNAPAASTTPVIPRLRSRVEQKPFTVDAQGNKQAPMAYFGQPVYYAAGGGIGGLAAGGQASRAIRGPGTGVSDSIPARINGTEPAALADGEFVIDARTVSKIGDGSTEAGTRELEAMVDRVWHADSKARRGEASGADKQLVA